MFETQCISINVGQINTLLGQNFLLPLINFCIFSLAEAVAKFRIRKRSAKGQAVLTTAHQTALLIPLQTAPTLTVTAAAIQRATAVTAAILAQEVILK